VTYQPGGFTPPPFDSSTVRQGSSRKDTWVIIGTVAGVLVMLGLGAGAIYLITKKDPPPAVDQTATADPLAAAAAQQFTDAVTSDDPASALPTICAAQKAALQAGKPTGRKIGAKVTALKASGTTGSFTLVETSDQGETKPLTLTLVKEDKDWKVCS
jgi:hypothetical protein